MIEMLDMAGLELYTGSEQSGVLSFRSDRVNCEEFAGELGRRGICVRAGLHCAPLAHRSAGSLESGTVRLSFSPFINDSQIIRAADTIKQIINNA